MSELSVQTMTRLVTAPYRRGAETLSLTLGADAGGETSIVPYDFREYGARHGAAPPAPAYVVSPMNDVGAEGRELEVTYAFKGATQTAAVSIPPRTFAGVSFAVPLPPDANATLRLQSIRQRPIAMPGAGRDNWAVVALLGNIAKLAWVLGCEQDLLRRHALDVSAQRRRSAAHGVGLDNLGVDFGVPRFPPRAHSFDADTIALYHLDAVVANNGAIVDEATRLVAVLGIADHPGVNRNAQSGVTGKFGNGFGFPGQDGFIEIPNHADFNLAAARSFTFEAFAASDASEGPPRALAVKGRLDAAGALTAAGWSLMLGSFRGLSNNLRWAVSDGVSQVEIFADLDLADGRFHHTAASIDRVAQRARLFLDGVERASADIGALGALTNAEAVRLGRSNAGHQFSGALDEVRLSKTARADFHPVLGEGDEFYRQRLGIFESWLLPTPGALLRAINGLVNIDGNADPFVLVEKNRALTIAGKVVRLLPASLAAGQSIGADGNTRVAEADVVGVAADDVDFQESHLQRHDQPQVVYGADENNRRMQTATKRALDSLLALLAAASPPIAGRLAIERSYVPGSDGLHGVGRALVLRHQTLPPKRLAVEAHRAGFDFVRNQKTSVYASVAAHEKLEIVSEAPPAAAGIDLMSGETIDLSFRPGGLPADGQIKWVLIPCGAGRAHFVKHTADAVGLPTPLAERALVGLTADAPGEITVRVECAFKRGTATGTRTLRIGIKNLNNQETIAANGDARLTEAEAVGALDATIKPMYLVTSNAPVDFGVNPDNRRMQIALERPFNRLVALLGAASAKLQINKAFDAADPGLHKAGRAIRFQHTSINVAQLGALAHQSQFDFVQRKGSEIYCSVGEGEKIEIASAADLNPVADELTVGTAAQLRVRFSALPPTGSYNWTVSTIGRGRGTFDFAVRPQTPFTPTAPGLALLSVTYLEQDAQSQSPYTFEIRFKPALDVPATIIPKHQYDLIMNILNYFHPIGVEVLTESIRGHVIEVEQDPLRAFPDYTYPDFRV